MKNNGGKKAIRVEVSRIDDLDGEYDHVPGVSISRETYFLAIGVNISLQNNSLILYFDVPRVFIEPVECSKTGIIEEV